MKQIPEPDGFWIRHGFDSAFFPVTEDQFILAERDNGFHAPAGQRATRGFFANNITGTTFKPDNIETVREFDRESLYYSRAGKPITVEQWDTEIKDGRLLFEDAIMLDTGTIYLRTQYIGIVLDLVEGAALFGTITTSNAPPPGQRMNILAELETYDSATAAYIGHLGHRDAIAQKYHCRVCKAENRPDPPDQPNS